MKNFFDVDMRKRSGKVSNKDPLVSFIYILMRDYVVPGDIETIMDNSIPKPNIKEVHFANGWLADYAEDITKRIYNAKDKSHTDVNNHES